MWRPGNESRNRLPEERRALAERYTIDAEEARRREQLAAEAAARAEAERAAEAAARAEAERAAAEQAAREAAARIEGEVEPPASVAEPEEPADVGSRPLAEAPGSSAPPGSEGAPDEEPGAAGVELPIYRWFGDR
jgi:hypothetical protein